MYTLEENYQDALDKIEELQERIDKAIEYIERQKYLDMCETTQALFENEINNLLDILRGETNE